MEEERRAQVGAYEDLEVIRLEAQMPTARFTRLIGVPERSYRRWQHRQRHGRPVKGPWPTPSADRIEANALAYADRYPQRGSKTIAMLMRADGHYGPNATVYRALKRNGRVLEANYQAERRQHAEARRAAFVVPPSAPNQVWQLFTDELGERDLAPCRSSAAHDRALERAPAVHPAPRRSRPSTPMLRRDRRAR